MTSDEATQIIATLRFTFGARPQPEWTEPGVLGTWTKMLAPYTVGDGLTALNEYAQRCEAQLNAGKPIYFPAPIDFDAVVRVIAREHEREDYQRQALDAAIRCDGTRWIDNEPNAAGIRPFPSLGSGVVPCPTCSPAQHAKALGGDIHSRMDIKGEQPAPAPCRGRSSIDELPVSLERAREYMAQCRTIVASWSNQSPLKQALERGWSE